MGGTRQTVKRMGRHIFGIFGDTRYIFVGTNPIAFFDENFRQLYREVLMNT